jgi:hypothetical protein
MKGLHLNLMCACVVVVAVLIAYHLGATCKEGFDDASDSVQEISPYDPAKLTWPLSWCAEDKYLPSTEETLKRQMVCSKLFGNQLATDNIKDIDEFNKKCISTTAGPTWLKSAKNKFPLSWCHAEAFRHSADAERKNILNNQKECNKLFFEIAKKKPEITKYKSEIAIKKPEITKYKSEIAKYESSTAEYKSEIAKYESSTAEYKNKCLIPGAEEWLQLGDPARAFGMYTPPDA